MPQARDTGRARAISTTNRRNLLTGATATLLAGAAIACQAKGATVGADAELIALANRVVDLRHRIDALHEIRHDAESEQRTEPEMDRLYTEQEAAVARIDKLPGPTSLAGAKAVAAAAHALLLCDIDGKEEHANDAEWLAFVALEYIEGEDRA